jgi:hypothetical protein
LPVAVFLDRAEELAPLFLTRCFAMVREGKIPEKKR